MISVQVIKHSALYIKIKEELFRTRFMDIFESR